MADQSRRGGPLPTGAPDGGVWMIDLKAATKTDGRTGAGTPADGITNDTQAPTVTEVATAILQPAITEERPREARTDKRVGRRLTHASFFSGVGGLDIGLERGGWETVSFAEIEPYASAVLRRHWPGVPNLGCVYQADGAPPHDHDDKYRCLWNGKPVTDWGRVVPQQPERPGLQGGRGRDGDGRDAPEAGVRDAAGADGVQRDQRADDGGYDADDDRRSAEHDAARPDAVGIADGRGVGQPAERARLLPDGAVADAALAAEPVGWAGGADDADWTRADLFTGGFPCQDLSIAGKRKGLAGHRSGLAYAFLDLVERHQPRALLLENVPGLLSSNRGRDLGALLRLMGELGYGVAYRVLDARFFAVPQRRKRVFILGLRSGPDDPDGRVAAERAAEVLAVGTRCPWHPPAGTQAGPIPPGGPRVGLERYGVEYVGSWQAGPHGFHGYDQASVQGHLPVVSHALTTTHTRTGRLDPNGETFVVANAVSASAGHHGHSSPRGDGSDNLVVTDGASADAGRDGAADGMARRLDDRPRLEGAADRQEVSQTLRVGPATPAAGGPGDTVPIVVQQQLYTMQPMNSGTDFKARPMEVASPVMASGQSLGDQGGDVVVAKAFVKSQRAREKDGEEKWVEDDVAPTLNTFDTGDTRAVTLVQQTQEAGTILGKPNSSHAADMDTYIVAATLNSGGNDGGFRTEPGEHLVMGTLREHVRPGSNTDHTVVGEVDEYEDVLLPLGLDSHRYRCCGNGVVSTVAEWIGARLYEELST